MARNPWIVHVEKVAKENGIEFGPTAMKLAKKTWKRTTPVVHRRKGTCPKTRVRNPSSGRCVKRNSALGRKILGVTGKRGRPSKGKKRASTTKKGKCAKSKIRNPKTGNCVKRSSTTGIKVIKRKSAALKRARSSGHKKRAHSSVHHKKRGRPAGSKNKKKRASSTKKGKCPKSKVRNSKTGNCVKRTSTTGKKIIKRKSAALKRAHKKRAHSSTGHKKRGRPVGSRNRSKHFQGPCPENKVMNPKTGNCVKRSSTKGKHIMAVHKL